MTAPLDESPGISIVLGVESQIGLAIVRELGRAGVKVIALSHDRRAMGLRSRYVAQSELIVPRSDNLLRTLRRLGEQHGHCSLLMVSEANLQWMTRHLDKLGPFIHPAVPPASALAKVLDKQLTLAIAVQLGIAIPKTEEPLSLRDIERLASDFPFPAVLKWKDAEAVSAALSHHGLPFIKAEYIYSGPELLAIGRRYAVLKQWPLVQQYCRGQGLGQFFFIRGGQVLQRFQHLRVAEWPPEGGFSSVCDGLPTSTHEDLQTRSVELLRTIGWEGVAMVEYRLDPATGTALLMEINGRFWGSFPLAMHSQAKFSLLAHRVALGLEVEVQTPPLAGLRCRMVLTEIKRLVRLFLQPDKVLDRQFEIRKAFELRRFAADFFRPKVRYFLWSSHDPLPWLADVWNMAAKLLRLRGA